MKIKKVIKKIKYFLLSILLSPFIILIFLLRPIKLIRFGQLGVQRIGSISIAEQYLLNNIYKKGSGKPFDIWVVDKNVCNKQLLIILKRKFLIFDNLLIFFNILKLVSKHIKIFSIHLVKIENSNDTNNLFDKYPVQLKLTEEEIIKGQSKLKDFGIPKNAKIVCITCRDSIYLKKKFPKKNFDYHSYRDANINHYIPAIKFLISKGFYVIRLGRISAQRVNFKNKKFVDYPFHKLKSDFMDFYLTYKSNFWISGNVGIDEVAVVFRRPILLLNMAPLMGLAPKITKKKVLFFLKSHVKKNKKMSFEEIFNSNIVNSYRAEDFKKNKISLNQLKPKEIKNAVIEMIKLMNFSWRITSKKNLKLQKKFKKIFIKKIIRYDNSFKYKSLKAIYCFDFLKKNNYFLKN